MYLTSDALAELSKSLIEADFSKIMMAWYQKNGRSLPWRERQHDPYGVWISEIMLQQTTVAAVIPYYNRWMSEFPTLDALAKADQHDVLRLWSGLGYYARARNLKKTAEIIALDYGGRMPSAPDELLKLPGIGRYTAGAIASIAFDKRAPILDGNIMRVFTRLCAIENDLDSSVAMKALWALAEAILPSESFGEFNQSVMELGATVCLPGVPKCHACPVQSLCRGFKDGDAALYPRRAKKARWEKVTDCSIILIRENSIAMIRRPENGVWGGLWETPRSTCEPDQTLEQCARETARKLFGGEVEIEELIGPIKHVVMNRKIDLYAYRASLTESCSEPKNDESFQWITLNQVENYPLPAPQKSLLALISIF